MQEKEALSLSCEVFSCCNWTQAFPETYSRCIYKKAAASNMSLRRLTDSAV